MKKALLILAVVLSTTFALAPMAMADNHKKKCDRCVEKKPDMDSNKDGKISRLEFRKHHNKMVKKKFEGIDGNKDGFISKDELDRVHSGVKKDKKKKCCKK